MYITHTHITNTYTHTHTHTHTLIPQFMRYLEIYSEDAGVKIIPCDRYSSETCGAKVVVTRHW